MSAEVHVRDNESLEEALKRFKRKVQDAGVLSEVRKREHFEKPSEKKKRKMAAARKKLYQKLKKLERMRVGL